LPRGMPHGICRYILRPLDRPNTDSTRLHFAPQPPPTSVPRSHFFFTFYTIRCNMLQIEVEWNGESPEKHRRKASTVHGWLTKIRGTIMDNEAERQRGRHEMMRAAENRRLGRTPDRATLFSLFRGQSKRSSGSATDSKPKSYGATPRRPSSAPHRSSTGKSSSRVRRSHTSPRPTRHSSSSASHRYNNSHRSGDRSRAAEPVRHARGPPGGNLVRRTTAPAAPSRQESRPVPPRYHSQRQSTTPPTRRSSSRK